MLWPLCAVVILAALIIPFIIESFVAAYGQKISMMPYWLREVLASFFWFSGIWRYLKHTYTDVTKKKTYLWNLKPMVGYVFMINILASFAIRFGILPFFDLTVLLNLFISYIGSMFVFIVFPMKFAEIFYPAWEKWLNSPKLQANRVKTIAEQSPTANRFMQRFPTSRIYVFDHAHRNTMATCLFLYREDRSERPGMQQDIVLEVPVDMKRKQPVTEKVKISHYVFNSNEHSSSVLPLNVLHGLDDIDIEKPLDQYQLDKYDALMDRFPSIQSIPLRIALRHGSYETI